MWFIFFFIGLRIFFSYWYFSEVLGIIIYYVYYYKLAKLITFKFQIVQIKSLKLYFINLV